MHPGRRPTWRLCAIVVVFAGAGAARAAETPKPTVLFDGKTLAGWTPTDFSHAGEVVVKDGAIVLGTGRAMTGITTTRQDLPKTDYELVYEAQRVKGSDFFAAATFPVGKSFLSFVNGGWGGTVTGLSSLGGADASENETGRFYEYKNNTWYRFRVRVTDKVVRCWINDEVVVDVGHEDRMKSTRLEMHFSQPMGFATWESTGVIRKVEVRKLTPEEVAATKPPED
ncbi:MAG: DUF1080 domain-containing protein [Isosphaeraceae bacterium]